MGMDYQFAGSASYPRFNDEIRQIVEILGGTESKELRNRINNDTIPQLSFMVDYANSDVIKEKYIFPKGTNSTLVRWFNNLYEEYSLEDTIVVYNELCKHRDKILSVSHQVIFELEMLIESNKGWHIW